MPALEVVQETTRKEDGVTLQETVSRCGRETDHARVPGTNFCRCTHVMYDGPAPPTREEVLEGLRRLRENISPEPMRAADQVAAENILDRAIAYLADLSDIEILKAQVADLAAWNKDLRARLGESQ